MTRVDPHDMECMFSTEASFPRSDGNPLKTKPEHLYSCYNDAVSSPDRGLNFLTSYPGSFGTQVLDLQQGEPGATNDAASKRDNENELWLSAISVCYYFGPLAMNQVQAELPTRHREPQVKGLR